MGAAFAGEAGEGDGGPEAVVEIVALEGPCDHGFSRHTDEEGAITDLEVLEMLHQREVVLLILAESKSGIKGDALGVNAFAFELDEALEEVVSNLADDIVVVRLLLHGLRRAGHVHDDEAGLGGRGEAGHGGIAPETGDVVENVGPGVEGSPGHGGLHRIDGDEGAGLGTNRADDGEDAAEFLGFLDGFGAGAGGLAADVEDVGTFREELEAVLDGATDVGKLPAVGKGVGRDIEDAHDHPALVQFMDGVTDAPDLFHGPSRSQSGAGGNLKTMWVFAGTARGSV